MKLQSLRPILRTNRFDETISFYVEVLNFTLAERNDDWGWASLYKDDVELMLAKPNQHSPFDKPVFTGSFYFTTDNADELWNQLKDKTTTCYEPETFEWGMREFAVYDNNGYLLQFGQETGKDNK